MYSIFDKQTARAKWVQERRIQDGFFNLAVQVASTGDETIPPILLKQIREKVPPAVMQRKRIFHRGGLFHLFNVLSILGDTPKSSRPSD
jgi:hypothetical protein